MNLTDRQKHEIARLMDFDPDEIHVRGMDWRKMAQTKFAISLSIGWLRGGSALKPEHLGLGKIDTKYFVLGKRFWMPDKLRKACDANASSARKLVGQYTVSSPFGISAGSNRSSGFIEIRNYDHVMAKLAEREANHFGFRDFIIENWETIRIDTMEHYLVKAVEIYGKVYNETLGKAQKLAEIGSKLAGDALMAQLPSESEFVTAYMTGVERMFPSVDDIKASWRWSVNASFLPMPDIVGEAELAAIETRIKAAQAREAEANALLDADTAEAEAQILTETFQRINADIIRRQAQQAEEEYAEMFRRLIGEVRVQMYETVAKFLETNNKAHGRYTTMLQGLCDLPAKIGCAEDKEIAPLVNVLRSRLAEDASERSMDEVVQAVRDIATVCKHSLDIMGVRVQPLDDPEIDDADHDLINAARVRCGLEEIDEYVETSEEDEGGIMVDLPVAFRAQPIDA